ncbi:MAG: 4Fe-4S binding protein [Candidatus Aenigmatarchaeota archaeon]
MEQGEKRFTEWHGIPREKIDWHPTIDESKCIGCGMCAAGCGRNVYDFDFDKNKPVVARPLNCLVGCTTCQVTCLQDAISFPDKHSIRNLIKEKGLLAVAKKELLEKLGRR